MKNHLALIAFILGFIGMALAAFQNNFIQEPPPVPSRILADEGPKKSLKEIAARAAATLIEEKILHKEPPPKPKPIPQKGPFQLPLHPYQMIYTALGVLAVGMGGFSWAHHIKVRLSGAALALGLVAVAWQWVLIGVGVAIVILIFSKLGS